MSIRNDPSPPPETLFTGTSMCDWMRGPEMLSNVSNPGKRGGRMVKQTDYGNKTHAK